ncbi:cellulase family glycosylhydrolase [Williamsia maris]|uniref:Cellulase (Glycosyl hydrolase family 5) n=1 Tax=Williamsia maris TaxID=72806 RepID=A0ABT1HH78_9NOCA|nr:cellulase family glycosylhydrolase [Williamsia maris]MCP2177080.1 Cellulase (glycosyl hydrolase family 5) [Williamsia maris]
MVALVVLLGACGQQPPEGPRESVVASPAAAAPTPLARVGVGGGNLLLLADDDVLRRSLASMNDLGIDLLRLDLAWPILEPAPGLWNWAPVDRVVDAAKSYGIEVLGILDYTPGWASDDPTSISQRPSSAATYGDFAGRVAEHYAGRIGTYEIWNEPNGGFFFRPGPDPAFYTAMLASAYRAIKAADPDTTVLGGAVATAVDSDTTMNGRKFVSAMYAAGAGRYLDALSVHPYSYPGSYSADPTNAESAMRMVADMYSIMRRHGDGAKKIWATELGFPTEGELPSDPGEQSDVVIESIGQWSQLSFAGPIVIHELRDRAEGTGDKEDAFGLMRTDFTPKPLYDSIKRLVAHRTNDDVTYRRMLSVAAASRFDLGGQVTPWYRSVSVRGESQTRQQFVRGSIICSRSGCFASPAPVVAYLDRTGFAPMTPFVDGRQAVGDLTSATAFWSPRSGVHTLRGAMLEAWQPEFGFPVTDEYSDGEGRVVRCEHATLRRQGDGAVKVERS